MKWILRPALLGLSYTCLGFIEQNIALSLMGQNIVLALKIRDWLLTVILGSLHSGGGEWLLQMILN
jgi:hypothetical protein